MNAPTESGHSYSEGGEVPNRSWDKDDYGEGVKNMLEEIEKVYYNCVSSVKYESDDIDDELKKLRDISVAAVEESAKIKVDNKELCAISLEAKEAIKEYRQEVQDLKFKIAELENKIEHLEYGGENI